MDYPTFGDSFSESLNNASDIEFSLNVPDILFPLNSYLLANLFAQELNDLDTQSIIKFNAMQLSASPKSDIDKLRQYTCWEYVCIFLLSALILGFNKI